MEPFTKNGVIFHKAVFIDPVDQNDFLTVNVNTGSYSKHIAYHLDPERIFECKSGDKLECIEDLITFRHNELKCGFNKDDRYEVLGFNVYDIFTVMLFDHHNGKTGLPMVIMLDYFIKHFNIGPYIKYEPKDMIDIKIDSII